MIKQCEECDNSYETNNKDRRFCSCKCAAIHGNRLRRINGTNHHSDETKRKISQGVLKTITHKSKFCKICGQPICQYPNICKQYLIRKKSVNLQKLGFDFSKLGTIHIYEEYFKVQQYLYDQYITKQKSLRNICDCHNMTCESSLVKILDMYGIKRRTISQSIIHAIECGRMKISKNPTVNYKSGYHTTWDGYQIYYRSSFELDYAKQLDNQKIHYEVEALKITYTDSTLKRLRIAIPDFYIPSINTIIEIKSGYTYNFQNMKDKMNEYIKRGYSFKLVLDHKEYDQNHLPNNVDGDHIT